MTTPNRKKTALVRNLEADPWGYMSRLFGTGLGKMNVVFNTFGVIIYYAYLYFLDSFIGMGRLPYIGLVGDVSEHGIPSALLMATARAFVRQRLAMPGRLDSAVNDVNQQFCRDVDDTGRFMTLLCCCLNMADHTATWVNAGHAPALIYQPQDQTFSQPGGGGPALGVVEEFSYTETRTALEPEQIILMGTDGIWETQNAAGEPFGLERVKKCMISYADRTARDIIDRLVASLEEFRGDQPQMDDVTAVLIKVSDLGSAV